MDNEVYKVLYRKFRPKTFSDVYGQSNVIKTLKNELKAGRVSHAYLFTGSRGTGKTTCAKILAKAINCLDISEEGEPCGKCEACIGIERGTILDIVEIDAASNNGVDNIRDLIEEMSFMPSVTKYRVYIIDEVHMLSIGAFNALLKTLEEPPPHVVFILATTEVHKLPVTILSRCQRFDFNRIEIEDIVARLKEVASLENVRLEDNAAYLIAKLSDGALRDALSLLDRCIGDDKYVNIDVVNEATGSVGNINVFNIIDKVINKEPKEAIEIVNDLYMKSKSMVKLCFELIEHYRNLMLIKTSGKKENFILLSDDDFDIAKGQSDKTSLDEIISAIDVLSEAVNRMTNGSFNKVELEMSLVKLCMTKSDKKYSELLNRIDELEKMVKSMLSGGLKGLPKNDGKMKEVDKIHELASNSNNSARSDKEEISKESKQSDFNNGTKTESSSKSITIMDKWSDVLEMLKEGSNSIYTALKGSKAYINGEYILIDSSRDIAFNMLRRPEQRDKMRKIIEKITGRVYRLGPYKEVNRPETFKDPLESLSKVALNSGIDIN